MYEHDNRVVMTLDAGGTNFVFSAIKGCELVIAPVCLLSVPDDLDRCLSVLVEGFCRIKDSLSEAPVAISFAFPGPADYEHGVIGGLLMVKHCQVCCRRSIVNLKLRGILNVIKICWVLL